MKLVRISLFCISSSLLRILQRVTATQRTAQWSSDRHVVLQRSTNNAAEAEVCCGGAACAPSIGGGGVAVIIRDGYDGHGPWPKRWCTPRSQLFGGRPR